MAKKQEVTPFAGAQLPSVAALGKGLAAYRPKVSGGGGANYLKLDRSGVWTYGAEGVEVSGDSSFAVNPASICAGFVSWGDGEKLGEQMSNVVMGEAPIDPTTLPPTGESWDEQVGFDLQGIEGPDKDVALNYSTNSVGGKRAHGSIVRAIQAQYEKDPETCVPIVQLDQDSYQHKKYGKIFTPIFEVTGWLSMAGKPAEEEKKPAKRSRTKKR